MSAKRSHCLILAGKKKWGKMIGDVDGRNSKQAPHHPYAWIGVLHHALAEAETNAAFFKVSRGAGSMGHAGPQYRQK
jgi:hypothetical protein